MAKEMKDIKRDATGDIDLSSGDIVWTDCTREHQHDILVARKGDYRTSPTVGVGMEDFLEDERPDDLFAEVRRQFSQDGMTVTKVSFTETLASYE